tara:strand:- start:1038 stop:2162 length:1125 start_codon:yes stop_codon:yes gene_type:complete
MAKRNYRKSRKKIQPAPMNFSFNISVTNDPSGGQPYETHYLDLSQVASLVNRRAYRQGLQWALKSIKIVSQVRMQSGVSSTGRSTPAGLVYVSKLPQTWVMSNAWEKGFRAWMKQQKEAVENGSASLMPKFLDYKVHMDEQHVTNTFGTNMLPRSLVASGFGPVLGNQATPGEWEASNVVTPVGPGGTVGETHSSVIMAVGQNYGAAGNQRIVSLIDGYASSRAIGASAIDDPNRPDDMYDTDGDFPDNWLEAMTNQGTDQDSAVLLDQLTQNNIAPYPFENDGTATDTMYPGGANQLPTLEVHAIEPITGTTIGGTSFISGGTFPCGLLRFDVQNFSEDVDASQDPLILSLDIQVELVPGQHKGYLCEPMTEM